MNLLELADKVEAGATDIDLIIDVHSALLQHKYITDHITGGEDLWLFGKRWRTLQDILTSLDAAQKLHDAVLPDWGYAVRKDALLSPQQKYSFHAALWITTPDHRQPQVNGHASTPAASWVAAILRAKHAENSHE